MFRWATGLVSILKAKPKLTHLGARQNVRDPLDHKRSGLLLSWSGNAHFEKSVQLEGSDGLGPVCASKRLSERFSRHLWTSEGRVGAVTVPHKTLCQLQGQLWYVKDLFDVHEVGDVPRVLGEGAQRKSIMSDKRGGGVGESPLLAS